jgi:hypothetical protein
MAKHVVCQLTRKFRPLTEDQELLYGAINPQDYSVAVALKNAKEMIPQSQRKFRPLTDAQKSLYGAIDANPELFTPEAAFKRSEEMAKKSNDLVQKLKNNPK